MKKHTYIYFFCCLSFLFACESEPAAYEKLTGPEQGGQVFISKSQDNIHFLETFDYENEEPLDEENSLKFNVGLGALSLPKSDINISLMEDSEALDSLNNIQEINEEEPYLPFPENSYEVDKLNLSIQKGKEYSDYATLTYSTSEFESENNYALALSIKDASGYDINTSASTIIFAVEEITLPEPEPQNYNKSEWEVITFTSEEDEGEGENGFAQLIIDDNSDTFWHSCWLSCTPEESNYPHKITVDMKEVKEVDGFEFHQRQSGTRAIKDLEILVSDDNEEWKSLGDFTLLNIVAAQTIELSEAKSFRYFKLVTKSAHDGTNFSALGEVSTYILD